MLLKNARSRKELSKVLLNPNAEGPDPVYMVFSEVNDKDWENVTIISNGLIGNEYPNKKTVLRTNLYFLPLGC